MINGQEQRYVYTAECHNVALFTTEKLLIDVQSFFRYDDTA